MDNDIVLIAHNLRSCQNVGSLLRTADGLAINEVILTGYTPYPKQEVDQRLPHLREKIDRQIAKTSLGAEKTVKWSRSDDIEPVIKDLREKGYAIIALEQTDKSIDLAKYSPVKKMAIILGREVEGIEKEVIKHVDICLQIPMLGSKESFNVTQAAAMTLYRLRFF